MFNFKFTPRKASLLIIVVCLQFVSLNSFAETLNLASQNTLAKNQGDSDTCAFYAITGLMEQALKSYFKIEFDISEKFEWERSKKIKQQRPEVEFGDTYLLAQNLTKDNYFITEEQKKIYFRGLVFQQLSQLWVKTPWSLQVIELLKKNRQVVVTLMVSSQHINDQTGEVHFDSKIKQDCDLKKNSCGGHAVLITGFDADKKVFFFKNSWGTNWGQQGYGSVTFEHLDHFSDQLITLYFDRLYSPEILAK